jgi:Fe-coproporphyrin III synthase
MKVNPDFIERKDGEDLLLHNPTTRASLIIPAKKIEAYNKIKDGSVPAEISSADLETLCRNGVISATEEFPSFPRRSLSDKINNADALYNSYTKQFHSHKAPLGILWSITQRCNLRCPYCHASAVADKSAELSFDDLVRIADKILAVEPFEIVLNGGEPFLRKDVFDLISRLRQRDKLRLSINTNGTLLDERKVARLAELSMVVGVSIDGHDEEINRVTRGKGVLEKTIRGIKLLVQHGITTHILTTVTRLNFDHIPEIVDLTRSLGVEIQTLQDLHAAGYGEAVFESLRLTPQQEAAILPMLQKLAENYPDMTINTTELSYFAYQPLILKQEVSHKEPRKLLECTACTESLYIDAMGNMYPCVALPDLKMGNLLTDDFSECWENSFATRMIKDASRLPVTTIPLCRDCDRNHICNGGCRGDAISVYNDWFAPHPRCPERQSTFGSTA